MKEEFKVGDLVTGKCSGQWLQSYVGKINRIYIENDTGDTVVALDYVKTLKEGEHPWYNTLPWKLSEIKHYEENEIQEIKWIKNDNKTIIVLPDGRNGASIYNPKDKYDDFEGIVYALARAMGKNTSKINLDYDKNKKNNTLEFIEDDDLLKELKHRLETIRITVG